MNKYDVRWIWVRDNDRHNWDAMIFLGDLGDRVLYRYITVDREEEDGFLNGAKNVEIESWLQAKPFTAEHYFRKCLPGWLSEKAISNINRAYKGYKEYPINCIDALRHGFDWKKAPEGFNFWWQTYDHAGDPGHISLPENPNPEPEDNGCDCAKTVIITGKNFATNEDTICQIPANYCYKCGEKIK